MAPSATSIAKLLPADRESALCILQRRSGVLGEHIERLRAMPAHGNRKLKIDQLLTGLLLAFFDPTVRSLRMIEDKGSFDGRLDLSRMARSTTADALAVFDPACLQPIIDDLRSRVPHLGHADKDLVGITRQIVAADGTYLNTLADIAWALHQTRRNGSGQGQVRANFQVDVETWIPQAVTISGDDGESEAAAFAHDLLSGVLYVMDRNFLDFSFLIELLARDNDFVLRARSNAPAARVLKTRALTAADAEAGVVADELVELSGRGAPAGTFRRVTIHTTNRKGELEIIILLTNLTDESIAAHVIGAVYHRRWQIELFFKWLKTWARMDHLLSTSRNGITFQFYVAVIGVLMMYVQTGRRVSIYAMAAMGRLSRGECTLEEMMTVIARRDREREMDRARQARRRARKKLV